MSLSSRIKEARLKRKLTQEQLANMVGVAKSTITGYEVGNREPTAAKVGEIADALGVDVNFLFQDEVKALHDNRATSDEMESLIKPYRNLDDHGRETINIILDRETERTKLLTDSSAKLSSLRHQLAAQSTQTRLCLYTYLGKIACAGAGFYFDDIPTDTIEAPYKEGADFIIGVSGDSMEPDYHDGEKLYIKKAETLLLGDVGIFTVRNECFIKEFGDNGLISRNPKYENIPGTEDVRLIGRVLGKVQED